MQERGGRDRDEGGRRRRKKRERGREGREGRQGEESKKRQTTRLPGEGMFINNKTTNIH